MSKLGVVLVDTDEKYLMPLELKFIEEFEDRANIQVITDKEYFKTYFNSQQKVDILIINEELYSRDLEKHDIANLFILTEANTTNNTQNMSINRIYKYTSVKEIYNQVTSKTSIKSLKPVSENGNTKVIMIYSPVGGIGKTTVAMGMCAAISKCYKRVLYLNIETLQSFNFMLKDKRFCTNGLEKHMISREENIMDYFQGALGFELFSYLLPFKQSTASLNISIDDYKYLIEYIKATGEYDYIVVETSVDFTSEKTMMMSSCDKVIIVTGQDIVSVAKLDCLFNNIDCSDTNKFIFVCNKYYTERFNGLLDVNLIKKCSISEYIEWLDIDYSKFNVEFLAINKNFQKLAYMLI
jgi:cellulose biosynthesis protein BcsQ